MKVVVDRFEGAMAVLELPDGRTELCGRALLPEGVREGDVLEWGVRILPEERERREREAKDLQDRLKQRKS